MSEQLQNISASLSGLLPELILVAGLLIILITGLFFSNLASAFKYIAIVTCAIALIIQLSQSAETPVDLFNNMLRVDDFSSFIKGLLLAGSIISLLLINKNQSIPFHNELFILILAVVLGCCLLVSSINLMMVLLALELISLSSYILAGFKLNKESAEAGLKYFLFGTIATAVMIYGMTLLYGLLGNLEFSSASFIKNITQLNSPLLLMACLMVLSGFLFKVAGVPFHLWAPDVYEVSPTPIVAFFSVVPKLAGLAALARLVMALHAYGQSSLNWQLILGVIALLSILVGNLSALAQQHPKRMMAYSSIAQSGFMLTGLVAFNMDGIHFMIFYGTVFVFMNFAVFSTLIQFETIGLEKNIKEFAGLGRVAILPALVMTIALVALAGLPPTAGFTAKLFIFSSLWQAYDSSGNQLILILFIAGLLNTVVSLFFYLKLPFYLFIRNSKSGHSSINFSWKSNLLGLIMVIVIFYLFIDPNKLMGWINRINFVF